MKVIIAILSLLLIVSCSTLPGPYQSASELYPESAQRYGIVALGQSWMLEGKTFRVVGECKAIESDNWLQFIDTDDPELSETGRLDNDCSFVIWFALDNNELVMQDIMTCEEAMAFIYNYCMKHDILVEDYIQFAEPIMVDDVT